MCVPRMGESERHRPSSWLWPLGFEEAKAVQKHLLKQHDEEISPWFPGPLPRVPNPQKDSRSNLTAASDRAFGEYQINKEKDG